MGGDEEAHAAEAPQPGADGQREPVVAATSRPVIGRGMRLQWEAAQNAHVLLYPEGMVKLNGSAGAIMSRCDGVRTVGDIVADLERSYGAAGLAGDVNAFVTLAVGKGWLEMRE